MHAQEKQPDEQAGDKHRATAEPVGQADAPAFGPMTPSTVAALQRSAGNRAVARMLAEEQHSADPSVQRGLVDAALRSPGRHIESARREKLESFHQTDLSSVRVHAGPLAQRSAEAIGANAYTVGTDIVLGAGADTDETLGHETRHVKQQSTGPVAGTDNGAGLSVSHPGHSEEREAATDGAAFRGGAGQAPSLAAQRDSGHPTRLSGAFPVQRMKDDDKPDEKDDGQDEQKDGKSKKTKGKSKKALVDDINEVVDEHTLAHGGGRHGRVTKEDVRLRFPRDKSEDRTTQSLSHLSMLIHDALRRVQDDLVATQAGVEKVNDREVQGMLINDRLLFASNFNETIDRLRDRFGEELVSLRELLNTHQTDENRAQGLHGADIGEYGDRLDRAETKINAAFEGLRGEGDDATADAVRGDVDRPVRIVDADDPNIRELLTSSDHQGSVLMIRYGPADRKKRGTGETVPGSMHAEQKLLVALHKAGLKADEVDRPIAISGKYRPCAGCAAALRYYRDIGGFQNLQYNTNAGHYYQESVNNLASHLRHVVDDPHYRDYIKDILDSERNGGVSSSTLSVHEPPADATDNNGYELRIPAEEALGRGYVTASDSEGELTEDEDGAKKKYRQTKRRTFPYSSGAGGKRIGAGKKPSTAGRRARRVLTDEEHEEIRQEWASGTRGQRLALLRRYAEREGLPVSQAELREATGTTPSILHRLIAGKTGHEARDRRAAADPNVKRRVRKRDEDGQAVKKPKTKGVFKKGSVLDEGGTQEILDAINAGGFQQKWNAAPLEPDKKIKTGTDIKPSDMPAQLTRTLADLRPRYAVPAMAKLLRMTPDALKNHLNRKHGVINPKPASEVPEDVPMVDAPAVDDEDITMGDADEYPEIPGYEHNINLDTGEHFYIDEYTGLPYFYTEERMVLLPEDQLAAVIDQTEAGPSEPHQAPRQASRPSPEAMDVDDETPAPAPPEEEEEDEMEYVPARHGKGAPRRRDAF